jgi:2'-5' RNA ligase
MNKSLWFVAVLLPDDVVTQVRALQQEIADHFGPSRALRLPPHITVEAPFRLNDCEGERLVGDLAQFLSGRSAFDLTLKNFGYFRDDVVFIEVAANLSLLELHNDLRDFLRGEAGFIKVPPLHPGYTPHLTLANRDVSPQQHAAIWRNLAGRKFHARFQVHEMCLLRHNGASWDTFERFPLRQE